MTNNENCLEDILWEDVNTERGLFTMGSYNNSHYFLLPLFGLDKLVRYKDNYLGSYIGDRGRECYIENSLFILFGFDELDSGEFERVNKYMQDHPGFKFSYFAGMNKGKNLICYVLKASIADNENYDHITNGRYSYTNRSYRDRYMNFPFVNEVKELLDCICTKDRWYKSKIESELGIVLDYRKELWSFFEPEREILRYAKGIKA